MNSKVKFTIIFVLSLVFLPIIGAAESSYRDIERVGFRLEVPYRDFFPECRENYRDAFCQWNFLIISRPPLSTPTGNLSFGEYQLTLPTFEWNGYNYRVKSASYPDCSVDVASNLLREITEQRKTNKENWISVLPTGLSGCFAHEIVGSELDNDEYWVVRNNVLIASISCSSHGSVVNPNCGIEIYLKSGSVAIVGGYFPATNIEKFLLDFNEVMLSLSELIPVEEYRVEMKDIFATLYEVSDNAKEIARNTKDEIDGKY